VKLTLFFVKNWFKTLRQHPYEHEFPGHDDGGSPLGAPNQEIDAANGALPRGHTTLGDAMRRPGDNALGRPALAARGDD